MSVTLNTYSVDSYKNSLGGLKIIRVASFSDVAYIEDADDVVNIGLKPDKSFYTFELTKNVSAFTLTPNKDRKTGLISYSESLNLSFNKLSSTTSIIVVVPLLRSTIIAIAEDKNGQYVLLGRYGGMRPEGSSIVSGTSIADKNGYEVRLSSIAQKISHVNPSFITSAFYPSLDLGIFSNVFGTQFE